MPNWLTTRINIISHVPRADVGISAKDRIMHHNVIISTSVGYGVFFFSQRLFWNRVQTNIIKCQYSKASCRAHTCSRDTTRLFQVSFLAELSTFIINTNTYYSCVS